LSRPARILAATTVAAALAVGVWLSLRAAYEPYVVLFSQMERDDAGAVVAKLKELKVPYRVGADGTAVEVPEPRVHEIRLELASAGLPRGGGIGFESFDTMRLGATEFEQRVLYRRAMEGELTRTIGGIEAIRSARVHLVMPERSVFAARREPASASVVVRLRNGRTLGPAEVGGIVHLVAAAVPGLTSDRIALVTTEGKALRSPHGSGENPGESGGGGEETPSARAIESNLEEHARTLLERLLGPGHVDVRVSAEMDLSRVERTEDHYDPHTTVLRSEEATREHAAAGEEVPVAGVPGAESNVPTGKEAPPPAASGTPAAGAVLRETHTRNFEVDHVQEKRVNTSGVMRRLTVAVVVDGVPGPDGHGSVPRGAAELEKLSKLVRSTVGADEKRGDIVTVESIPFPEAEPAPAAAPPVSILSRLPQPVRKYGTFVAAGAALLVLFGVGLALRRAFRPQEAPPALLLAPITPMVELPPAKDVREEAVQKARLDPATASLVVRYWLGTGTPQETRDAA
jgi:flagellar M-ring protein FliF